MAKSYDEIALFWDEIFEKEGDQVPKSSASGNKEFDRGLSWLCENTKTVLDFGCGNGSVLFLCSFYGTKIHAGVDLSKEAICNAKKRAANMKQGAFQFVNGGVDTLKSIPDETVDAVVLSNIIDNLYPEDAENLLTEVKRILVPNGKIFVKLNPFLTEKEIVEYDIKVIAGNVLDDGLLLFNQTTDEWTLVFQKYFCIQEQYDIYYEEYGQSNRIFLMTKQLSKQELEEKKADVALEQIEFMMKRMERNTLQATVDIEREGSLDNLPKV